MIFNKIQKPWVPSDKVRDLENKITEISKSVEHFLINLSFNMGDSDSYLLNLRLHLNSCLVESEAMAQEYKSLFWFNLQFHPDYCATLSRVQLIDKLITEEIITRQDERYNPDPNNKFF
jgi:hypothetical protein